jgi:uncharacterized protein (UPF0210 family)
MLSNFIIFHGRGGKSQKNKPPDQTGCNQMDRHVKEVVTEYIKLVEMIVQGQGKIEDKTAWQEIPDVLQVRNTSYSKIISCKKTIIKMKRAMKSIGIDNNS